MSAPQVCVVGAGPRGLSVLERLCANARGDLVVHVVDPYAGRGGRVWAVDQPPSLLMNTITSQVSMFTDESVDCAGPITPGPSLFEWTRTLGESYPPAIRAEARALGPDSYPTRALYGHYLDWFLRRLRRCAPAGVRIHLHRQLAVALDDEPGGTQRLTLADGRQLPGLGAVVLAQGHLDVRLTGQERAFAGHSARYWPPANPAEVDLSPLRPGETVLLRGMGLAFFDHLALLTVGRGGRFTTSRGRLRYVASGREPLLVAGSRRGVPYHARGENEKGAFGRHEPVFLTERVAAELRAGRATFAADVWPLVQREVHLVYYTALLGPSGAAFGAAFRAAPESLPALLDRFGVAERDRWDWAAVACPHRDREFGSPADFHRWLLEHLRRDVRMARAGNVTDPVKAALDVLRDVRNEIRLAVDHGGITATSYRTELEGWYTPLNAYLSIGPPAARVAEMAALVEAGVLRVLGPDLRVEPSGNGFRAHSPLVPGSEVEATALVEARLPAADIRRTTDPLTEHLLTRGGCAPYVMPDPVAPWETGGLAVTPRPNHLLDATGTPHPRRFAYGVPTEAVHWVTAAGIRPGVNSVILADADAIARSALTASGVGASAVGATGAAEAVTPELLELT